MAITKHQLFKIRVLKSDSFTLEKSAQNKINEFLSDVNKVYVNHSICLVSEDFEEYGDIKSSPKNLLISVVYKDLSETNVNLSNVSERIRSVVAEEIEEGETLVEPDLTTEFERNVNILVHSIFDHKQSKDDSDAKGGEQHSDVSTPAITPVLKEMALASPEENDDEVSPEL